MLVFCYDKSFEGLLTALFDAYNRKEFPNALIGNGEPEPMFTERVHTVITESDKAERVWKSFEKRTDRTIANMLTLVWLSELEGTDMLIFRYMKKVFDMPRGIVYNFADEDILEARNIARKVNREAERIRQFVRFQKSADGTFFAAMEPQYNSLPLAIDHFRDRFSDQKWLIYDTKRRYGFYYDLVSVREVRFDDDAPFIDGDLPNSIADPNEKHYQEMWRGYFKSLTIKERINPKLQRQNMPMRYRKYITELK